MDRKAKRSTWISLLLHILAFVGAMTFHSADILVPSRSDGMEVSLITPADIPTAPVKRVEPPKYQLQNNNNADVNVKQPEKNPVPPKLVPSPAPVQKVPPKPQQPKKLKNSQINDLLNDLPQSQNAGKSQNQATGGSNMGTSDSNNLIANYADQVISRVRPFIIIPDGISPDAKAVVEVTLLPNMNVYNARLVKSSGNTDYDNNLLQAINRVNTFPPLPDGADFADFRKIKLTFRPQ